MRNLALCLLTIVGLSSVAHAATVTDAYSGTNEIKSIFVENYSEAAPTQNKFRVQISARNGGYTLITSSMISSTP